MSDPLSWLEKRKMMRRDIADAFSDRTGIGKDDFLEIFFDSTSPPPIGDFNSQYVADSASLEEIFSALGDLIGVGSGKIKSHYHREESFPQFGEHLLRAGAYE